MIRRIAAVAAGAALLAPATAAADNHTTEWRNAAKECRAIQKAMDNAAPGSFKASYGTNKNRSNAFGKCVSGKVREARAAKRAAARQCRAEAQSQGKGRQGQGRSNSHGQCVAAKVRAAAKAERAAVVNAARACKAQRDEMGDAWFKNEHGTNANKSNAFGKCVSKLAKAQRGGPGSA